ncbi:cytochrome P450 78A9-like [Andrographis paniculata]|uniref:cytochrome P450 78A9-like n=1 Tax=Andrographis paniculata TaxID=175694 RepID=UPI0021E872FC|nr:cytochrome P450 78A9-like [Andrographis paniculata]
MATDVDSLWLLVALASKCESKSMNTITIFFSFLLLLLLSWLLLNIFYWGAHPAGSAWGKHLLSRGFKSSSTIPGPRGFPVIGSMNLVAGLAHRKIAAAAEASRAKRLMAFSLGQTRVIATCHADVARQILNSSAFADRPHKESAYRLMFDRSIGFAPYGLYWTMLRKIAAAHLFCPKQLRDFDRHRRRVGLQLAAAVASRGRAAGSVRVRDFLKDASLCNMMASVFGRSYNVGADDPDVGELKDLVDQGYQLLGEVNWSDHLPFLSDFDFQRIRVRCSRIVPRVKQFVGQIIADHKKAGGGERDRDFVDILLSLHGADRLSDSDMIAVLWEMIFRGTDTVAVLMEWTLARLAMHPDIQSKVHEELDKFVGRSRAVTESDLTDLVYLTALVKEVLRLHPPGPLLSWSRLSIRDSTVDGHHVPAGTTAMVNMWAIMRDPEVWDDPLTFKPERWLVVGADHIHKDVAAPFGSGRRSCPGKDLGLTTVSYWLATLLHEFEFRHGQTLPVNLSEVLKLSCEMAQPLEIKVRSRRDSSTYEDVY